MLNKYIFGKMYGVNYSFMIIAASLLIRPPNLFNSFKIYVYKEKLIERKFDLLKILYFISKYRKFGKILLKSALVSSCF